MPSAEAPLKVLGCTVADPLRFYVREHQFVIYSQASYHGTPMVGMPLFAEQPDNMARAEERGYGLSVSVKKLNTLAKDLEGAIKRILNEPSFSDNAARISSLMRAHRLGAVEVAAGKQT